ncbi:glutathionyl-hydroquinone reductase YqjG isoform X2 [Nematostella vectensis]|uniref:glutathionyl-hydroquinone reductase YqjG isoform X2 n=1 Tax=Nematostella vectensis TaxID=45351 RepID=UPI00207702A2|nr:glutathionyl-hydroquinone reductase YqjG isoform X2 [Nematostella vectensis]
MRGLYYSSPGFFVLIYHPSASPSTKSTTMSYRFFIGPQCHHQPSLLKPRRWIFKYFYGASQVAVSRTGKGFPSMSTGYDLDENRTSRQNRTSSSTYRKPGAFLGSHRICLDGNLGRQRMLFLGSRENDNFTRLVRKQCANYTTTTTTEESEEDEIEDICPHETSFCSKIKVGSHRFPPEANRYHLYTTLTCPFAARVLVAIKLKGLESVISCTVMDPVKQPGDSTFRFTDTKPGCDLDSVNNCNFLSDIYELARPGFKGRWTVPVLWDKKSKTIVNNESGDLLRMVGSEFNMFCPSEAMEKLDLYPEDLQPMIDDLNTWIQEDISIGVYRAGLAHDQGGYDKAVNTVFNAIEMIETILSRSRYLTGELLTEADIRLFSSLIRFDIAYYTMFMFFLV